MEYGEVYLLQRIEKLEEAIRALSSHVSTITNSLNKTIDQSNKLEKDLVELRDKSNGSE